MKNATGLRLTFLAALLAATTALATAVTLPSVAVVATLPTAVLGSPSPTSLLTFTRTGVTTSALTVNYALSGTAVKWNDYRASDGSMPVAVTIPAGSLSTTMAILGVANSTNASPETATFTLSAAPAYAVGAPNSATITIRVLPIVMVAATVPTAVLGSTTSTGLLTFTRTGVTTSALKINYVLGGTAVKLTDYRSSAGTMPVSVTIPAGSKSATMTILAVANSKGANPETAIFAEAASPDTYFRGAPSSAVITLVAASESSSPPVTTPPVTTVAINEMDDDGLMLPMVGDNALRVLTPTCNNDDCRVALTMSSR